MIEILRDEDFDGVYRIMEESFPLDERRSYEGQKKLLSNPIYRVYVMRDESSRAVKAFITTYDLEDCLFVEHFAVSSSYRNGGLGSMILEELMSRTEKPVCLEVELPEEETACRRIAFYRRNGFYFNEYPYIQPAIEEGRNPIPLRIMSTQRPLTEEEYLSFRTAVYKEVYGC